MSPSATHGEPLTATQGYAEPPGAPIATLTEQLYREYGRQVYAYCLHKLRSREEAEDAVQTTFVNAFRSLQRGTTTQCAQAWLLKIAHNVCLARQTSSVHRLRLQDPDGFETAQETVPSPSSEGSLELIGLEEALERMPHNQRRAILLREWQGLSYREIAKQLALSQAAVEMLIFRGRRSLAAALERPSQQERLRKVAFGSAAAALTHASGAGAGAMTPTFTAVSVAARNGVERRAHRATPVGRTRR